MMIRILNLAGKDLRQFIRDRRSVFLLAAMPIAFTLFMGFAYQIGDDGKPEEPQLTFAWTTEAPVGKLGDMLFSRLDASGTLRPIRMERDEAEESLQQGLITGVLLIPSHFSELAEMGQAPQITVIADTTSPEGHALYEQLRAPISQLMSAVEIGQIGVKTEGSTDAFTGAMELAWEKHGASHPRTLVRLEQPIVQESENWFGDNPYNQSSPGILVQFAIVGMVTSAQIVAHERSNRTLQRLMTTAMTRWEILAGHLLGMFAIVFMQVSLLAIFGQWVLGVDYLHDPVGTVLLLVALGLWIASMGLLIGLLARGDDQVTIYSLIAMFVFSALGGAWFPLEMVGGTFARIGGMMPSAWAMTGLQNILIRNQSVGSALLPASVVLAYALGFFLLAVWRFGKNTR